ncbi:MAG: penicillin-binding protein activator [Hahellaceae bacterium]|nr:penicillin-binding protein activator [Hahellaceae bacterium]MCP5169844.1 penicillin-binding protein activator [Hahellaceae bacterium]
MTTARPQNNITDILTIIMQIRYLIHAGLLIAALTLTGCATPPTPSEQPDNKINTPADPLVTLLNHAEKEKNPKHQAELLLQAADLYLQRNQNENAFTLLHSINYEPLPQRLKEQYLLLALDASLKIPEQPELRLLLENVKPGYFDQVPVDAQRKAGELLASAFEHLGQPLQAAFARIKTVGLYDTADQSAIHEKIWSQLTSTPLIELTQAYEHQSHYDIQGWLQLAITIKQHEISLDDQLLALNQWLATWPAHPAALNLPKALALLAKLPESRPKKIAILLPSTGNLANAANAIREGFLSAYYRDQTPARKSLALVFINSDDETTSIHSQLLQEMPDLVIGPLEKSKATELSAIPNAPYSVLALNYLENLTPASDQFFQFGLSSEHEAEQIVDRLTANHLHRVITIAPQSDWGKRVEQAFSRQWASFDGEIAERIFYTPTSNLSQEIEQALLVKDSRDRARTLKSLLGTSIELAPRRRKDIDAFIVIATPEIARQLKPLFAFHFAADIPVYATSQIFTGQINPQKDNDLNGIYFTETPWVLAASNPLRNELADLYPNAMLRYDRLFAMGVDSYQLSPRLVLLQNIENSAMHGETGILTMNKQHQIIRKLEWARFSEGTPRPVN